MNLFNDDDLSIALCKVGGPLILFVCTPILIYIFWQVAQKELAAGISIQPKTIFEISIMIFTPIIFGIWLCRKGYGWFGGKK